MSDHTTHQSSNEIPYGYCQCGCGQKTNIHTRNETQRGYVKGEPFRFLRNHSNVSPYSSAEEAFRATVTPGKPDECWTWKGKKTRSGYGLIFIGGQDLYAHRISYEIATGKSPGDLHVLHHCDNPSCVNPTHLFLGTPKDNSEDKVRKGRHPRGEKVPNAKLTERKVKEIRKLFAEGISYSELGRRFGVTRESIRDIIRRRNWKHVP